MSNDADVAASDEILHLVDALRPALLRVSRTLRRESQRAGISVLDAQLLGSVKKNPGIGVSALAELEQMTAASMSSHMKRLVRMGWIHHARGQSEDRRRIGLSLTAKGRKMVDSIRRSRSDWLAARLVRLEGGERVLLAAAIGPLARLMEDC